MFSAISGYLWREGRDEVDEATVVAEELSESEDDWVMVEKTGPAPGNLDVLCYSFTDTEAALENSELDEAEAKDAASDEGNLNKVAKEAEFKVVNARQARIEDFFSTPGSSIVEGRRNPSSKSYSRKVLERSNKSLAILGNKRKNIGNNFLIKIPQKRSSKN